MVNLTTGGMSGGYLKYLRHLAPIFLKSPDVESATFYVHPDLIGNAGLKDLPLQTWPAGDHWSGYSELKNSLLSSKTDVVFVPSARWMSAGIIPTVVMVRNMEPIEVPFGGNPILEMVKNVGRAREARAACRKAKRVIAVSHHVRDFIVSHWSLPAEKVGVVCHGVDAPFDTDEVPPMLKSLAAGNDFIFTAGSIRPARGLEDLIGALGILAKSGQRPQCVIAGGVDYGMDFYRKKLERLAVSLGVDKQVFWAGSLSPQQMSWCYRRCTLFVMTTRAEACPNTALEAMAHGCLSVVTDKAPLPEFFKSAALYYQAPHAPTLAARIQEALAADAAEQHRLRNTGLELAAKFQWSDTARRTLEELQLAAGISEKS